MEPGAIEAFFAPVVAVRIRRMFGGIGIYADGLMFALFAAHRLYLKTDDATRPLFARAGSEPFRFAARGAVRETSYWSLPETGLGDARALAEWVALARQAAAKAAAGRVRRRGSSPPRLPR